MSTDQISVHEVSRILGVSMRTTYTMLRAGEIPGRLWRNRWIISRTAVERHVRELGLEVAP